MSHLTVMRDKPVRLGDERETTSFKENQTMNKPGWQTTEWWTTTISQILAMLTVFGVLAPTDAHTLEEALAKIIAATFLLATNAWIVVHYIKGRVAVKTLQGNQRPGGPILPVLLAFFCLAGPASAQQTTCLLPWRAQVERRLDQLERQARPAPPATDPEMKELLRQLLAHLQSQQALPIAAAPRQELPIAGTPRQELPISGAPRQELPIPGAPRQDLPTPGTPKQDLPAPGKPLQPLPGEAKPKPAGYQRYTLYRRSR
jgi:hypothetical protein